MQVAVSREGRLSRKDLEKSVSSFLGNATVRPPSSTIRTVSSLNSDENCLRRLVTYLPLQDFCQLM